MLPSYANCRAISTGGSSQARSIMPTWSYHTSPRKGNQRNFVWIWRCVTTTISWFVSCTTGQELLVTWRSCHLCSPGTPLPRSCFPVGYISELWLNSIFNTPVDAGGSGLGKLRPTISRLACCRQEVVAGKTLVNWTDEERVVYPPAAPAPKEDVADEPDHDANNGADNNADKDADDDKSEHDDDSDENTTPKKGGGRV